MGKHRQGRESARPEAPAPESAAENVKELDRIIFFSDAVFAIAITLLVLDIRVPVIPQAEAAARLPAAMRALAPKFLAFFISFWMISAYWVFHHQMCRHLRRYDRPLIMLNFLFLMWIVFLPFSADLFSEYFRLPGPNVIYSLTLVSCGVSLWLFWRHAAGGRLLVDPALTDREIRFHGIRALLIPTFYLLSIPIAIWVNPQTARQTWMLIGPAVILMRRKYPDLMK